MEARRFNSMKKEYLALFDLDGTLLDTSEVNYFAYKDALEPFGIKLQKSFFVEECNGIWRILKKCIIIKRLHIGQI